MRDIRPIELEPGDLIHGKVKVLGRPEVRDGHILVISADGVECFDRDEWVSVEKWCEGVRSLMPDKPDD